MKDPAYNAFCGSLAATAHVVQWGGSHVWKVGGPTGKVFSYGSWERGKHSGITFKVSDIAWEVLRNAKGCRPAPFMASRGLKWVQSYEAGLSDKELKGYLREAYLLAAANLPLKQRRELGLEV